MWRLQQPSACTPAVPCAEKAPMVLWVAHKIALVGRIFSVLKKTTGLFATRIFMHDAHWQCTWPSLSGWADGQPTIPKSDRPGASLLLATHGTCACVTSSCGICVGAYPEAQRYNQGLFSQQRRPTAPKAITHLRAAAGI